MDFAKNISYLWVVFAKLVQLSYILDPFSPTPTKYTVCMPQIYRNGYTVRANPPFKWWIAVNVVFNTESCGQTIKKS